MISNFCRPHIITVVFLTYAFILIMLCFQVKVKDLFSVEYIQGILTEIYNVTTSLFGNNFLKMFFWFFFFTIFKTWFLLYYFNLCKSTQFCLFYQRLRILLNICKWPYDINVIICYSFVTCTLHMLLSPFAHNKYGSLITSFSIIQFFSAIVPFLISCSLFLVVSTYLLLLSNQRYPLYLLFFVAYFVLTCITDLLCYLQTLFFSQEKTSVSFN